MTSALVYVWTTGVPGHPWQMVATSSSWTRFLKKSTGASGIGEGSVLRMGIACLQDVDILAKQRDNVHASGLDFPLKDDLLRHEFTMLHCFKFSATLSVTFIESMNSKYIWSGVIFEDISAPLFETCFKRQQDETMMRIKVILWETFFGWFEVDSCLLCIQVCKGCPNPALCFKSRYIPSKKASKIKVWTCCSFWVDNCLECAACWSKALKTTSINWNL